MQLKYAKIFGPFTVACALALSGCGGDSSSTQSSNAASGPVVRVEVTGDVASTLEKRGSIYCSANDLGPGYTFELYVMAPPEGFNMVFDRGLSAGEHPIVGSDDLRNGAQARFYYRGPDRRRFDKVDSATFVVEEVPTASGESFVARIDATMNDGEGATISLTADIDVVAGSQTFDECP